MEEESSRIDKLKQSLYRRGQGPVKMRGWSRFTKNKDEQPSDWQHKAPVELEPEVPPKVSRELPMRLFVFSVIFFIIALSIAAFIITRGSNLVSSDNIDIIVSGPVLVAGGETLSLQIDVVNRNSATLELVDLIVEFPEGTRTISDGGEGEKELQRFRESMGDLSPGGRASRTISARLFGEEGTQKEVSVGVEYRVADSNAIFFKEKLFEIHIGTAPISLLIDMPTEVNSGKDIDLVLEVVSNAEDTIKDVAISVEYPFGFLFKEAEPKPDVDDGLWILGDMRPQSRRTIHITGSIEGQDEEERTFRFTGGLVKDNNADVVETAFLIAKRSLVIQRPFVQIDLTLDRGVGDVQIANSGQLVNANVRWKNNLSVPVEDVVIKAVLVGEELDEKSVQVSNGFYRSIDNTVIWDKTRERSLTKLDPGSSGDLLFTFQSLDPETTLFKNGSLDVIVTISGNRTGNTPETTGEISSTIKKTVKFASKTGVLARAVYSVGPITNIGPIPPRADQETTYTVIWSVANTSNDLADAEVSAALPGYVRWVGTVSPNTESVSFNASASEVRWKLGSVPAGTGFTTAPREVAFQIQFLPSISQIGSAPTLIGPSTLSAYDTFTETKVGNIKGELTSAITTDPIYHFGTGQVGE